MRIVLALVALTLLLALAVVGMRATPYGVVRFFNRTDRDYWFSGPTSASAGTTFEAWRVPAGSTGGVSLDHIWPGDVFEVDVFATDPGPPRPGNPSPTSPVRPAAHTDVSGASLLRTRSEGALELILDARGEKVALRIGSYVQAAR